MVGWVRPRRESARAHILEQVGIGKRTVLWCLQRPDVERDRRPATRRDDPVDQELRGRHVAVLGSGRRTAWNTASMLSAVSKRARAALVSAMVCAFGRPLPRGEAEMSASEGIVSANDFFYCSAETTGLC